tara:strand:+ start:1086 stop:2996 length:1911 start_codon:yes stop_codon:yes gene_type:complete
MANNIEIIIKSIDQSTAVLKKVEKNTSQLSQQTDKLKKSNEEVTKSFSVLKTAAMAYAAFLAGTFIKDLVSVGQQIESLQVRLNALFGSTEEGAKAFQVMTDFASKVPFSLEQIQMASGNLAVVADDADDLAKLLQITGNVAATTGLDFRTTAEQIQRSFSGGIASADIFRERGVRAMLGFEAGATVSIEDTIAAFERVFGEGGEFGKMTDKLANTFEGTLSMIGDSVFNFKRVINEGFFAAIKDNAQGLLNFLQTNATEIENFARVVGTILGQAVNILGKAFAIVADNAELLLRALGALIALKIGSLFIKLALAIRTATLAMISFNLATKQNIFFAITGLLIAFIDKIIEAAKFLIDLAKIFFDLNEQMRDTEKTLKGVKDGAESVGGSLDGLKDKPNIVAEAFSGGFKEVIESTMGSVETIVTDTGRAFAQSFVGAVDAVGVAFADMVIAMDFSKEAFKNIFKDMAREVVRQVAIMIARLVALKAMQVAVGMPAGGGGGGFLSQIPIVRDIPIIGGLFAKGGVVEGGLKGLPSFANGGVTTQPQLALIGDNPNNREAVVPLPDGRSIPVSLQGDGGGVQTIGTINILPNANLDQALIDKPMSYWKNFTESKILPALNSLGKSGATTTLNFKESR